MTNDDIDKELWEACWINSKAFDQYIDKLKNKPNDTCMLMSRGKAYLIIGRYEEAHTDLTRLLEIESKNTIALKYRGEINYMVRRYSESIADLENLLTIKPDDAWARETRKLVKGLLKKEFGKWTSGNPDIDNFIQQMQLKARNSKDVVEWIPFDKFTNIKYLTKGGFGTVFKAIWTDGYIISWDSKNGQCKRNPQRNVCLKNLNGSKESIKIEFLNERAFCNSRSHLMHKDFHSGNIVNENMYSSFITDFGLCRPVSQDSSSAEIFGVLPYIAPEVLYTKKYTQKSDIYSFGIIMSEVFTGYPPYHDIPHNEDLAIQVCLGHRPKIRCEVPQLLLDLMNKCLDAKPQTQPTAKELRNMLEQYTKDVA
ncbi:kinase-like domain-containing protein [Gigaspora rosea]|uniref:Kinase-like domain-containing protein n=1 Tax=Gigaspora rosea TaxID=44941 RepID=A0A397UP84_9GLOM|nr:kinase-like domain-containing protein [Gigaspora rosea]